MQKIKQGMHVEMKVNDGFWYTVMSVQGDLVSLAYGKSGRWAGTFSASRLKVIRRSLG